MEPLKKSSGFTLMEVMFVLALLSVLITLSTPLHVSILDKQTERNFLDTLEMDILYMQSLAYNSRDYYRLRFPDGDHYVIKTNNATILERDVPDGWHIDPQNFATISFNHKGTIREAGTMVIQTLSDTYELVCPLGKGGCYVAKQ